MIIIIEKCIRIITTCSPLTFSAADVGLHDDSIVGMRICRLFVQRRGNEREYSRHETTFPSASIHLLSRSLR